MFCESAYLYCMNFQQMSKTMFVTIFFFFTFFNIFHRWKSTMSFYSRFQSTCFCDQRFFFCATNFCGWQEKIIWQKLFIWDRNVFIWRKLWQIFVHVMEFCFLKECFFSIRIFCWKEACFWDIYFFSVKEICFCQGKFLCNIMVSVIKLFYVQNIQSFLGFYTFIPMKSFCEN